VPLTRDQCVDRAIARFERTAEPWAFLLVVGLVAYTLVLKFAQYFTR
jgi:hypothetical protein